VRLGTLLAVGQEPSTPVAFEVAADATNRARPLESTTRPAGDLSLRTDVQNADPRGVSNRQ
jgi:hypothetical protein